MEKKGGGDKGSVRSPCPAKPGLLCCHLFYLLLI